MRIAMQSNRGLVKKQIESFLQNWIWSSKHYCTTLPDSAALINRTTEEMIPMSKRWHSRQTKAIRSAALHHTKTLIKTHL